MSASVRRWAIVCAVVGLAAASTSLYIHYRILTQPGYVSGCDINQTFSCSDAYRSQYGSVLGIPVALFGVLWFAFVLLLIALGSRAGSAVQENVTGYLFAVSTTGAAVILYLAYAAFFVLKELCVFCLITYAAVIGLFILSGLATSIPMTSLPRRAFRDLRLLVTSPLALIVAIVFLAGAGSAVAFFPRAGQSPQQQGSTKAPTGDARSDFEQWWMSQPRQIVPVSNEGAAVIIVKFTDFQCIWCSRTYFDLRPILARYQAEMPGAVKLVSKDFALDRSCNPQLSQTVHPAGCASAVAVRLARQYKRDAEMEQWLYSNQGVTPAAVRQAAASVGHVQDFDGQYAKALEGVKADIALGFLLNVGSTPTFFVNGVRTEALQPAYWDMAIRFELKRAGKLK